MSKRFAWLLGATLVLIAFLLACGSTYNHSSDGLVLVTSQGSALVQSYSFSLASGGMAEISNPVGSTASETCVLPGIPSSIILDPAGAYAYAIISSNPSCPSSQTGIQAFKVNSNGTITASGSPVPLNPATVQVCVNNNGASTLVTEPGVPVVPVFLAMDSAGKYLFVADGATTDANGNAAPGAISVFALNNGGLTEVTGTQSSPFTVPASCSTPANDLVALAVSPTIFPAVVNGVANAVCATMTPPTTEVVYVVDRSSALVWEFGVNTTSGVLGNPGSDTSLPMMTTGVQPDGVAVDPCNRFVYVSDYISNQISAYSICNGGNTQNQQKCPTTPDGSLYPIAGSPFSNSGNATYPGPLVIDAYGNFLYVLNGSNSITAFRISTASGSIQPLTPPVVATGSQPKAIAIRSDDSWLFVTNFNPPTVSQYSVTPATGMITPVPQTTTDNYPWGVAVK